MVALVVGSIEFAFRWTRDDQRRLRYIDSQQTIEKDMLDYLVEGIQAVDDITTTINASSKDTERFAKMLSRSARILPFITSLKLRRKCLSKVASNINRYSDKVQKTADFIGNATPAVRDNQIPYIERSRPSSPADVNALIKFAATAGSTANILPETLKSIEGMRHATLSIKGVSGELNAASSKLATVLEILMDRIKAFGATCEEVQAAAIKKLTEVQNEAEQREQSLQSSTGDAGST